MCALLLAVDRFVKDNPPNSESRGRFASNACYVVIIIASYGMYYLYNLYVIKVYTDITWPALIVSTLLVWLWSKLTSPRTVTPKGKDEKPANESSPRLVDSN